MLLARNRARGESVARQIARFGNGASAVFLQTDLSAQEQVRAAAAQVSARWESIDILINNAGARFDAYGQTPDGIEQTFATNHLGHFLLTCLLLDRLAGAGSARVITIASSVHTAADFAGDWQFDAANYDRRMAYAKSKLANVLFANELAARLIGTKITSNGVDPGIAATRFARNNGLKAWLKHLVYHTLKRQLVSAAHGAETTVFLASDPSVAGISGGYFRDKRQIESSPASHNKQAAAELWRLSLQLAHLDGSLGASWPLVRP
jgi:NAD(P)-dependent dehydrogenase (short-subunit alcohol dehydrogenase family)